MCLLGINLTTGRESEAAWGGGVGWWPRSEFLNRCLQGEWGLSFHCTMWDPPTPHMELEVKRQG